MGPLQGIKVIDLSRILAGPWATQALADFGASVLKIEKPISGDDTRHWGPPFVTGSDQQQVAAYFLAANRGKQSLCIDFNDAQQNKRLKHLIAHADIVVENYLPGKLATYGLDYSSLSQQSPQLIYCSITGFGQTGPDAQQPGYDAMIQARSGLMSITGAENGQPQKVGVAISDLMTGMYAVSGILAALYHRQKTGDGQHIDLALFDTQVATLANQNLNYLTTQQTPKALGNAHPNIVPYQSFITQDGNLMLAVGNDQQFQRLCHGLQQPALISESRFNTNQQRVKHRQQLIPILQKVFLTQSTQYWIAQLQQYHIPCSPIQNIAEVFSDPQLQARDMLQTLQHPDFGQLSLVSNPVKFSKTPIEYIDPPPTLNNFICTKNDKTD